MLQLLKEDLEVIPILGLSLQITHPVQERLATPPGSMSPTLSSGVGSFMSKNQIYN